MAQITYTDKVALNINSDIPDINKVNANDMNEIKSTVNTNAPIGSIQIYAGSTAPNGWLICDGSAVSRTTYANLFNIIGTTYGAGDGSTTFNLPNLKGRIPVGLDNTQTEFDTLGETGGSKYLQEHKHTLSRGGQGFITSEGNYAGVMGDWGQLSTNGVSDVTTGNSGNLQPYIVLNYIILY